MNLLQAQQAVVDITARPDKVTAIKRAINFRIGLLSSIGDFKQDLAELDVDTASLGTSFTLQLSAFVRFRKFKYLRPSNRPAYITPIEPDNIFTKTVCDPRDRYYIAGNQVRVNMAAGSPVLQVGWYQYPEELTSDTATNWLLTAAPYAIIDGAAATIFKEIGDDASAQRHEAAFREYSNVLIGDHRRS
jgi:hypothetical protein